MHYSANDSPAFTMKTGDGEWLTKDKSCVQRRSKIDDNDAYVLFFRNRSINEVKPALVILLE